MTEAELVAHFVFSSKYARLLFLSALPLIQGILVYLLIMNQLEKRIPMRKRLNHPLGIDFKHTIKSICRYPQKVLGPRRINLSVGTADDYLTVMSEGLEIAEGGCEAAIVEIGKSKTLVALKASDTRRKDKVLIKIMPRGQERVLHLV